MQVVLTADAIADLVAIRSYIALHNPSAASRLAEEILGACDRLEHSPERGRPGLVAGTREVTIIFPYVIVYRVAAPTVEILKILRGARDRASQ